MLWKVDEIFEILCVNYYKERDGMNIYSMVRSPANTQISSATAPGRILGIWSLLFNGCWGKWLHEWSGCSPKLTTYLHVMPRIRINVGLSVALHPHMPFGCAQGQSYLRKVTGRYSLVKIVHNGQSHCCITNKLSKTKRNLLYIRNQSVPRCKHFPPWL